MRRGIFLIGLVFLIFFAGCKEKEYVRVGPQWEALYKLKGGGDYKVTLDTPQETYKVGEEIVITVESDRKGRLWVFTVGADDTVTMIFPNDLVEDNHIEGRVPLRIPPEAGGWKLKAQEPVGHSLILAVVTSDDVDEKLVRTLLEGDQKDIRVEKMPSWGLAKKVVEVIKQ